MITIGYLNIDLTKTNNRRLDLYCHPWHDWQQLFISASLFKYVQGKLMLYWQYWYLFKKKNKKNHLSLHITYFPFSEFLGVEYCLSAQTVVFYKNCQMLSSFENRLYSTNKLDYGHNSWYVLWCSVEKD